MKAWRLHNMKIAAKVKAIKAELTLFSFYPEEVERLEAELKETQFMRLKRGERRTHFAAEVATPSPILWALFKNAGMVSILPPELRT